MPIWRFLKKQYDLLIRVAATKLAVRSMYLFAVLESIIIPFPVDPLLVATVLARPARWRQFAIGCASASVIGGVGGWAIGRFFSLHIHDGLAVLPAKLATPATYAAVETGFAEFGIFLVFLGAFSPVPYKIIAISAGLGGFGLVPFVLTSIIGRGLRFAIIAAIARHNGNPKVVILLVTALVCLFAVAIGITR